MSAESNVRSFAELFPTPAVLEAVKHAEAGRLTWLQVAELFRRSLATSLAEVQEVGGKILGKSFQDKPPTR